MAQLKDLLVAGPGRVLNDLYVQSSIYVTNGIKIGSANELKSFGTGLSLSSAGVLSCSVSNTTYTLGTSGNTITLTPNSGSQQSITAPYATSAGSAASLTGNIGISQITNFTTNVQAAFSSSNPILYTGDGTIGLNYSSGLTLSGSNLVVNFAGTGSATTAARSDHSHTNMVTGSGLTSGYFVVGNNNSAVKISSMYPSTSSTTWSTSSDVYVPTMKAISSYVTGLGYTSNAGTVTSVTIAAGLGITVDNATAIQTSGTRTISAHAGKGIIVDNAGINVLCDSPLYIDDDDDSKLKLAYSTGLTITSGGALTVNFGTSGSTVAYGNHTHTNMVTGSGTNNYLVKWSGTNTVTNGATYDTSASNSTIAQRTANGYLYATYFNNSNAAVNIASYTVRGINFTSSDGFIRNTPKANFTSWLGLGELAYLSAASGNEGKYLSYDGSSEYSWSGVNSLTGWSALSTITAVNDFMTGNTLKFAEVKSYTTAALDGNDGLLLSIGYPGTTNGYGMQLLMDDNNAKTTIYARGRKATNYDSWRKLAHSGNLTVSISNNTLYLKVDGSTVSTATLPNTCLAEGTKILMANRTEKNVEDVIAGDSILSYDPNTNQLIEAIVVGNYETGVSDDFVNYYFDDGSFVTIFGKHCLYSATEGTARGVDFWEPGWEGINDKGETITYIGSEDVHNAGRKRHFDLHSSNKLYYANGILNAQSLTLDYPQYKSSNLPQSFITALKQDFDSSASLNTFKFDRKVGSKLVPLLKEMKQQRKLLDDNKKLLADTDYIVAKFTEGLINTVEWLKAKADRANWRSLVNKAEEAYATAKARYDAYKQQYAPTNTKRERFNAAVARDNACLAELKTYFANHK